MLKEGVVTQNVEVYWPQKDRFNPELMEMLYPIPQSSETDFASVVTGLGLRLQKSEHSEEDRVLQKATVVTQRMLDVEHTKALAVRRSVYFTVFVFVAALKQGDGQSQRV